MTMAMSWKLIVIALVLITDSNRSLIGTLVISSPFLWNFFGIISSPVHLCVPFPECSGVGSESHRPLS